MFPHSLPKEIKPEYNMIRKYLYVEYIITFQLSRSSLSDRPLSLYLSLLPPSVSVPSLVIPSCVKFHFCSKALSVCHFLPQTGMPAWKWATKSSVCLLQGVLHVEQVHTDQILKLPRGFSGIQAEGFCLLLNVKPVSLSDYEWIISISLSVFEAKA